MIFEKIRNEIKIEVGKSIGYYEDNKCKQRFKDDCSNVAERWKQVKLNFFRIQQNVIGIIITMNDVRSVVHLEIKIEIV